MKTSAHTPEEVERYRKLADHLLNTQYDGVQSQLAKAWGVAPIMVGKLIRGQQKTLSERAAKLLCDLAGEHYPLPTNGKAVMRAPTPPAPTPTRRPPTSNTLDKVLDLFEGKWGPATSAAARALKDQLRDFEPEEWMSALGELAGMLKAWEKKHAAGPHIEDPDSVLMHQRKNPT